MQPVAGGSSSVSGPGASTQQMNKVRTGVPDWAGYNEFSFRQRMKVM